MAKTNIRTVHRRVRHPVGPAGSRWKTERWHYATAPDGRVQAFKNRKRAERFAMKGS